MRPIREKFEEATHKLPSGPAGIFGNGNAIGGVVYFAVSTLNGINPVDGINIGFNVESHNIERLDGKQRHTFRINSFGENTAQYTSKFKTPPSTIDFFLRDIEIQSVEKVEERRTLTTWEIVLLMDDRKAIKVVEEKTDI